MSAAFTLSGARVNPGSDWFCRQAAETVNSRRSAVIHRLNFAQSLHPKQGRGAFRKIRCTHIHASFRQMCETGFEVRGEAVSRILSRTVARPEMTIPLKVLLPTPL